MKTIIALCLTCCFAACALLRENQREVKILGPDSYCDGAWLPDSLQYPLTEADTVTVGFLVQYYNASNAYIIDGKYIFLSARWTESDGSEYLQHYWFQRCQPGVYRQYHTKRELISGLPH